MLPERTRRAERTPATLSAAAVKQRRSHDDSFHDKEETLRGSTSCRSGSGRLWRRSRQRLLAPAKTTWSPWRQRTVAMETQQLSQSSHTIITIPPQGPSPWILNQCHRATVLTCDRDAGGYGRLPVAVATPGEAEPAADGEAGLTEEAEGGPGGEAPAGRRVAAEPPVLQHQGVGAVTQPA